MTFRLEAAPAASRVGVDDHAAADGQAGRRLADDEPVARGQGHRRFQRELSPAALPRGSFSASSRRTRAGTSAAPLKKSTWSLCSRLACQPSAAAYEAQADIDQRCGAERPRPRHDHAAAQVVGMYAGEVDREPAAGQGRSRPPRLCVCIPRMRARKPPGRISTSSPTLNCPSLSVPVTTVPKPAMVKMRSMGRRGAPLSRRGGTVASASASACLS